MPDSDDTETATDLAEPQVTFDVSHREWMVGGGWGGGGAMLVLL